MKRYFLIMLIAVVIIFLVGCAQNGKIDGKINNNGPNDDQGITGYIMAKKDGRILVVSPDAQDFSSKGGVKEYYEAIWFSSAPGDINLGEKVKVLFSTVRDSYPGQSEIEHLEVIPVQRPQGAKLTEAEALSKALATIENKTDAILVVKSIEYDDKSHQWNIRLKDAQEDEDFMVSVDD